MKTELKRKGDVDAALEAIEILAGHQVGAGPLRDVNGAAYAMVTMKGIFAEIFEISFFADNCETRS